MNVVNRHVFVPGYIHHRKILVTFFNKETRRDMYEFEMVGVTETLINEEEHYNDHTRQRQLKDGFLLHLRFL